jgi:hypothetical protein
MIRKLKKISFIQEPQIISELRATKGEHSALITEAQNDTLSNCDQCYNSCDGCDECDNCVGCDCVGCYDIS